MATQDNLKNAPVTYFLLGGLALAFFYYMSSYNDGVSMQMDVDSLRTQLTDLNKQISDNEAIAKDMPEYERKLMYIGEQFQKAISYLPSDQKNEDILRQFNLLASTAGVNIRSVKPKSETQIRGFYEELSIEVELKGTYSQITNFLSLVSKIPRIINIKDLDLKLANESLGDNPVLNLSGILVAFRFLDNKAKEEILKADKNVLPQQ